MTEQLLDRSLLEARRLTEELHPSRSLTPVGCLTFARARRLALDPDAETGVEKAHRLCCRRCSRMAADFARTTPHLSLWDLVRSRAGGTPGTGESAPPDHLAREGCRSCAERLRRLEAELDLLVRSPDRVPLRHPMAAAAAVAAPGALARAASGVLEAELFQEADEVLLEVRTKDRRLARRVVCYRLRGQRAGAVRSGYAVLQEDVEGWYTAQVSFPPAELYADLAGACEELLVLPVEVDLLSREERDAVLEAALRSRRDPRLRRGWHEWIEGMIAGGAHGDLSDETWELVCAVRERLS